MTNKPVKIPGPEHPITITQQGGRVVVTAGGQVIADSRHALTLQEAAYPAVQYIPRDDVDMSKLARTTHSSYCPYKGDASYFSIPASGQRAENAVWTYEHPHPAMAQIAGYVAFYPDRVDSIEVAR
nr:DUF427 domain-containing protein [uncultured Cupriavidus sp.]